MTAHDGEPGGAFEPGLVARAPGANLPIPALPPARRRRFSVGLAALALKVGPKLFALLVKLVKAVKLGKAGLAAASLVAWASITTWQFAVILVGAVAFHEYGHVWAMKRRGIRTRGFYLIPFVGGMAVPDEEFPSEGALAFTALIGPVFGFVLAAIAAVAHEISGSPILAAAAGWMALVNLINLMPINPLDGGRVLRSIAFSLHSGLGLVFMALSVVAAVVVAFWFRFEIFGLLAVIGGIELVVERRRRQRLPGMNSPSVILAGGALVAMVALLWCLMHWMQHEPGAALALAALKG